MNTESLRVHSPALSLVLCSRNDQYMGNSLWRLETTLNYVGERVQALGRAGDVEVLVTDWGSDVPLREVVRLGAAARDIVSFVTVPSPLARKLQGDSPFPEVLALNAAARRARGRYIGRIDQDTLVGERSLRWFFETIDSERPLPSGVVLEEALLFANRRDIPYRVAARTPGLRNVAKFVRWRGASLPVWWQNPATGDLFWTSAVGIWLAHRNLWHECGGYDERLVYYNWMETDMICRLRQKYPIVDLGALTDWDFYHLEHFNPRAAWFNRPHARTNEMVDPAAPPPILRANSDAWGLQEYDLPPQPAAGPAQVETPGMFLLLMLRVAADMATDRIVILWKVQQQVVSRRSARVRRDVMSQPVARWPGLLWTLWAGRYHARIRRVAGRGGFGARKALTAVIAGSGLLGVARRMRARILTAVDRDVRRSTHEDRERFVQFDRNFGASVAQRLTSGGRPARTALVVSSRCPTIEGELCTIKTLQLAGFTPVVLLEDERQGLRPFYERAGAPVRIWSEFVSASDYSTAASAIVKDCWSVDELMTFTHAGVRVGMHAVCTALRRSRMGMLNMRTPGVRALLVRLVAASMAAAEEAERILEIVGPDIVLSDHEYTPKGEFFDTCLASGRQVIAGTTAHRSDALIFKRYGRENRDDHMTTLSSSSWAHAREIEWTEARRTTLAEEVASSYVTGDWFHTPWLQSNGHRLEPEDVRRRLGIDVGKKTAFIFPHVLWDAPVMWGRPLFSNYQQWFVETVAAACRNTEVNWVIKLHPDHVWKHEEFGYRGETSEVRVVQEQIGSLPPHITLLPPETRISTLSLFPVMDYCVTVRGTAGVEAAMHGIPVLTAGASRYSERGFTIDSASRDEYLAKLARIHELPPLSSEQRELAERFAYGLFVLRPLKLTSITWDPSGVPGVGSTLRRTARITPRTEDDWRHASDVSALAEWFVSRDEDFLGRAG